MTHTIYVSASRGDILEDFVFDEFAKEFISNLKQSGFQINTATIDSVAIS